MVRGFRLAVAYFAMAATFCIVTFTSANAQQPIRQINCKIYSTSAIDEAPEQIAAALNGMAIGMQMLPVKPTGPYAIEYCKLDDKPFSYAMLLPPKKDTGVCHFIQVDNGDFFSNDGTFLHTNPPGKPKAADSEKMFETDGECPLQGDSRYVWTRKVPIGVFREILAQWRKAATSEQAFSAAIAFPERDKLSPDLLDKFKQMMTGQYGKPLPIDSIYVPGDVNPGGLAYCVWLRDRNAHTIDNGLGACFDLTPNGWKIVGLRHGVLEFRPPN
jgi:hypothetical protein